MYPWLEIVLRRKRNDDLIAFNQDPLTKWVNLKQHCFGEFSMANVQANATMEDESQVEVASRNAFYLGVYDGDGGTDASQYILDNLFNNLLSLAHQNDNDMTAVTLRDAVSKTEEGFLEHVKENIDQMQMIGKSGSCCLAGVLWKGVLHVANLGDSRAVIGYVVNKRLRVEQLTRDHNCKDWAIRQELHSLHPNDHTILMEKNGLWLVKGIIMVSRSIGHTYLKRPEFSLLDSFPKYETVPDPFTKAVVSAEPEMVTRAISDTDKFLIFASDGLWELMLNEQAAEIIHNNPRKGIAKRLLTTALVEAARRKNVTYRAMQTEAAGSENLSIRRTFHDDISVIVVFLDKTSRKRVLNLSYRGSADRSKPSEFARSRLIDTALHSFPLRGLKNGYFKGSRSKGQSSRIPEGLDMEPDQSCQPKNRWNTLKKRFAPKKR